MKKTVWYRLTLGSTEIAAGEVEKRKAAFDEAFTAACAPRMMALFQQSRTDGGIDLFLTPQCIDYAAQLIDEWGCTPCDRPSMVGLFLMVGHNEMTYYLP